MSKMISVAAGFGRGLGVLDINKNSIANCCILNPNLVSAAGRERMLAAFEKVKAHQILKTSDELLDAERLRFEHEVLRCFGLEEYFERIKASLLSMQKARIGVKL